MQLKKTCRLLIASSVIVANLGVAAADPDGDKGRDKRGDRDRTHAPAGHIGLTGSAHITLGTPNSAPPATRQERVRSRRGSVWVPGSWQWRNLQWQWQSGRFERARRQQRWQQGQWKQDGANWTWVDHRWEPAPLTPDHAPPALRAERTPRARWGSVWVAGDWRWQNGAWQWQAGHFERQRARQRFVPRTWKQENSTWIQTGGWTIAPMQPDFAPPAPRVETAVAGRGRIWVNGRWTWNNGDWQWKAGFRQRAQRDKTYVAGRWEQRGSTWVWIDASWQ